MDRINHNLNSIIIGHTEYSCSCVILELTINMTVGEFKNQDHSTRAGHDLIPRLYGVPYSQAIEGFYALDIVIWGGGWGGGGRSAENSASCFRSQQQANP